MHQRWTCYPTLGNTTHRLPLADLRQLVDEEDVNALPTSYWLHDPRVAGKPFEVLAEQCVLLRTEAQTTHTHRSEHANGTCYGE
jgi:hypothetical protein